MAPPLTCDSAVSPCFHGCLVFLHWHFPRRSPPSHPLDLSRCSQQQPSPRNCSTIPELQLPATAPSRRPTSPHPTSPWWMYGCCKDCLILIPFRLPQISCFTLSLKCFSFDSDNCPMWGLDPWLQFPYPPRAGPVLLTLLFFPLVAFFYRVLRGSRYSFLLVRFSCPPSAGVLHALLCLKVYSWCIRGERCTPYPPTPSPSCSLPCLCFKTSSLDILKTRSFGSLQVMHAWEHDDPQFPKIYWRNSEVKLSILWFCRVQNGFPGLRKPYFCTV